MATPTEQVVVWCTNCERDFLMDAGLTPEPVPDETEPVRLAEHPCPVCPLKDAHHLAARRVQELQPWLLHSDLNESTMQRTMNEAAAQGWILRDVRVGHVLRGANPEQPDGDPLFLAVFHRDDYDREAHRVALEQLREAELAMLRKRREVELALAGYLTPFAKEAIR